MVILDGFALAQKKRAELATRIAQVAHNHDVPGLVVIVVGEEQASQVYVRNKMRAAQEVGIRSHVEALPSKVTQSELLSLIDQYNRDPQWQGILVQLPLPAHIDEEAVIEAIDPIKDVDGFHPENMGKLWSGHAQVLPSTAAGIMSLLDAYQVDLAGKHAVIIGRSNIVGKPMAALLIGRDATVTLAHSKTQDLKALAKTADILVVAVGRAHMITADYIKPGAVVIDVGINRHNGHLVGDVKFDEVAPLASLITPVPKGVGPMTVVSLLEQTLQVAQNQAQRRRDDLSNG